MADEPKPYEKMIRGLDPETGIKISIGAEVWGSDGKLGEVDRVIVDAKTDRITDLVVKHGFLFSTRRVVPLVHVERQEGSTIHVGLDREAFKSCAGFAERRFRAPDPDYVGPPDFDYQGSHRGNMQLDTIVAMGSQYSGGKIFGFPGGERLSPSDSARPTVEEGTDVLDVNGEKVGDVSGLTFASDDGAITGMRIKEGFLFKKEVEVPAAWVEDVTTDGVVLNVPKDELEALFER
jgi:uncharacterized protein YrrD